MFPENFPLESSHCCLDWLNWIIPKNHGAAKGGRAPPAMQPVEFSMTNHHRNFAMGMARSRKTNSERAKRGRPALPSINACIARCANTFIIHCIANLSHPGVLDWVGRKSILVMEGSGSMERTVYPRFCRPAVPKEASPIATEHHAVLDLHIVGIDLLLDPFPGRIFQKSIGVIIIILISLFSLKYLGNQHPSIF